MYLLDVNALLALVDSEHVHHETILGWFGQHRRNGWSTCPLTENGFVRILSSPSYANGSMKPLAALKLLDVLKVTPIYEFWPDSISLTDESLIRRDAMTGTKQITDVYLLALAFRRDGKVVTFDKSMPWHAIHGARKELVVVL